jgi:hypothetical protein
LELSNWAPEHSDALREFITKGMTFSEAARAIKAIQHVLLSQCCARARPAPGTDWGRPTETLDAHRASAPHDTGEPRASGFKTLALPWPVPVFKEAKPVKLRCVAIEPRHLSLIELERGDCRYPYGGDEEGEAITFCGHPRRPGSSYCAPHFHLSRNPVEPVSAVSLRVVEAAA